MVDNEFLTFMILVGLRFLVSLIIVVVCVVLVILFSCIVMFNVRLMVQKNIFCCSSEIMERSVKLLLFAVLMCVR